SPAPTPEPQQKSTSDNHSKIPFSLSIQTTQPNSIADDPQSYLHPSKPTTRTYARKPLPISPQLRYLPPRPTAQFFNFPQNPLRFSCLCSAFPSRLRARLLPLLFCFFLLLLLPLSCFSFASSRLRARHAFVVQLFLQLFLQLF